MIVLKLGQNQYPELGQVRTESREKDGHQLLRAKMRMREWERVRVNHKIKEWLQMSNPPYICQIWLLGLAISWSLKATHWNWAPCLVPVRINKQKSKTKMIVENYLNAMMIECRT